VRLLLRHHIAITTLLDELLPKICNDFGSGSQTGGHRALKDVNLTGSVGFLSRNSGWLRGSVVERRSSAGVLSLSCARPVADG